ncbi:MAG TPA: cytochrome c oxidase subunit II [Tepidiformaceae bacterium]|nr:cytochrome c oxidase subunit II [Tepidiformaceae bacterium]
MRIAARRRPIRAALVVSLITALSLMATTGLALADASGQPKGITEEANKMHDLYLLVLALGGVVFLAVEAALVFMIIRYRRKNDELPPQTHGNNLLEVIWTTIPIVIVLVLFVFSFITLVDIEHDEDPSALTVDVQGFQYQWQFTYNMNDLGRRPSGAATPPEGQVVIIGKAGQEPQLVIPVGEPVEFTLHSNDVIHSFYVRDFLYKLDVIPGRDNRFTVTANETGEFTGQCAELCGLDHALMRFSLKVVERSEFDAYIQQATSGANAAAQRP